MLAARKEIRQRTAANTVASMTSGHKKWIFREIFLLDTAIEKYHFIPSLVRGSLYGRGRVNVSS